MVMVDGLIEPALRHVHDNVAATGLNIMIAPIIVLTGGAGAQTIQESATRPTIKYRSGAVTVTPLLF